MSAPTRKKLDIVGLLDIAAILQVSPETPKKWRRRNQLPAPDALISGNVPVWNRDTITKWASEHGKLPNQRAKADAQDAPMEAAG